MDKVSFPIYIPDGKKFHWTPNTLMAVLFIVPGIFCCIYEEQIKHNNILSAVVSIYFCLIVLIAMVFLLGSYSMREPLNGVLNGAIIFEKDTILLNGTAFSLNNVSNVNFAFRDFYGQKYLRQYKDLNPKISQGVNNYVTFIDINLQEQLVCFQLKNQEDYKSLIPFINVAVKAHRISFKQAIDLVGIENVSI